MARCAFHPDVETSVRCVECDRPICPKDFVPTPVGYKCPDCARPLPSARRTVQPRQLAMAALAAGAVGIGGAFAIAATGLRFWLVSAVLGMATGEAARRASGGHRTTAIAVVAGAGALAGTLLAGFNLLSAGIAVIAAVVYVNSNRW
jgi:hypothetical protein